MVFLRSFSASPKLDEKLNTFDSYMNSVSLYPSPDRPIHRESDRLRGDGHSGRQPEQLGHSVGPEHHLPLRMPHHVPAHAALHSPYLRRGLRLLKEHIPRGERRLIFARKSETHNATPYIKHFK